MVRMKKSMCVRILAIRQENDMGRFLITCFVLCRTVELFFSVIQYCVKMRKVETINFRFGGRSTTFATLHILGGLNDAIILP